MLAVSREEFIRGLREAADWLEATPGMPHPKYGVSMQVSVLTGSDEESAATVAGIADAVALPMRVSDDEWRVQKDFPGVALYALATARSRQYEWDALTSYSGAVTP